MKSFTIKTALLLVLSAFFVPVFSQDYNLDAAKQHLQLRQKKLQLSDSDFKSMTLSSSYISPTTGWYHAYFIQSYQSIDVYNGVLNVALKDGHVVNISNNFVPFIENRLASFSSLKAIDAKEALLKTLQSLNLPVSKSQDIIQLSSVTNLSGKTVKYLFENKNISPNPVEVKLFWYPYETEIAKDKKEQKIALTWNVNFLTNDKKNSWSVQVDANSGAILSTVDNVIKCSFGHIHTAKQDIEQCESSVIPNAKEDNISVAGANSYNVFAYPLESPSHGSRTVVANPYTSVVPTGTGPGTTNGWHDNGTTLYTDTRGNNVFAQEDTDDNDAGGIRPNPSNYDFDYPYTLGLGTAAANQNAAITNLFFWNNLVHDVLWKIGFDEPSGNFQTNNMGRGGVGGDFVYADAQDGSGTSNANFYTPSDGNSPRMQMFIFNDPATYQADSDFDNAIIAHEYGHGWSIRLTGGPNNTSCLENAEQGGEGWSDYLGLMLTTNWASLSPNITSANIPRGIGTYVLGETTTGDGIRPYKYSYDMATINSAVTYAGVGNSSTFSQPHGIGSIWCTMLWDMTWEIIMQDNALDANIYNTSNMIGNVAALKLVNEGLRLQPCSPSFIQARDAILAADQALFAGKYRCAIGRAFARRGLGLNASTGSSTNDRVVVEDYTPIGGNSLSTSLSETACSGTVFQYTGASNVAGTTFSWSRAAVAGITNAASSSNSGVINETLINTTNAPIVVTYVFSLSPNGCGLTGSLQQSVQVTVNPAAAVPTIANYTVCQNGTVPAGQGLVMPVLGNTNSKSSALENTLVFERPNGSNGINYYYKSYSFVATATGSVTFEMASADFDTYLFLYQTSFSPSNPSTNLVASNDDIDWLNLLSRITYSVTQGQTYYVVVSSYNIATTGNFNLTATQVGFINSYKWYTAASGGSPIFTGNTFNPVGVSGSGISTTGAPIIKNYFVAAENNTTCRATTTFSVIAAASTSVANGTVSGGDTVCAIFNSGILTLSGHTGNVIAWEQSEDNFATYTTAISSSTTYNYAGLVNSKKYRAVLSMGSCSVAKSKAASLNVISPMLSLVNAVNADTVLNKVSLTITSEQKIDGSSKIDYVAGKHIVLNEGFEATNGSVFKAEIATNECFIPVTLTLQPAATAAKDVDISSLYPDTPFPSNAYLIPFAWSQFGTQEVRRSLIKFDMSSIPASAVIDSAFLTLSFSQKLVDDNPPFTGHFGANAFEINRVLADWSATATTWNNQPTTTNTNTVTVAAASSQTQDYSKINIKNLVADQLTNANYGLMIKYPTETPYKITCLAASEETIATKRPKLVVYYRYK